MEKLKHHLHASKLHYMGKPEAEELAESYDGWLYHDTDEEDVPPGLDAPSVNSGAPLTECRYRSLTPARQGPIALRRSRSAPQTPSPPREGRRRRHSSRPALADAEVAGTALSSGTDDALVRVFISVESSIRAARHAQRLSLSAADAFDREAITLERALGDLHNSRWSVLSVARPRV